MVKLYVEHGARGESNLTRPWKIAEKSNLK